MSAKIVKATIPVKGMISFGCGKAEQVLHGLTGVVSAKASYADRTIAVEYDGGKTDVDAMANALAQAGCAMEQSKVAPAKQTSAVQTTTLGIKGMSCSGCETKVEQILSRLAGVKSVKASFSANSAVVAYDGNVIGVSAMAAALGKADYTVAPETGSPEGKGKKFNINQFIGIAIVLFAVYFIIEKTVGFNFIPAISPSTGYGVLFLVGLLTSLHCVAMCGGINMSQCISKKDGSGGTTGKIRPSILYNTGRVISYTIIGGIVGALGSVVSFSGWMRGVVAVLSGIFMVVMGLSMLGIFPWLNRFTPRMPKLLRSKAGEARKGKGPFIVGLLNGLMPCGPLQAMQLYALGTGSFLAGALSMLLFSLGTVPLMFGLGALSSLLSSKFTSGMMKVSAALVLILGLIMVNRGFALSGVSLLPTVQAGPASGVSDAAVANTSAGDIQTITTRLSASGYPVITVQKGIPVKWDMQADAGILNGCNGTIVIPKFNIEKKLQAGDNIIEFTPSEASTIPYSCWMGMITSKIVVVDGPVKASAAQPSAGSTASGGAALSGGCCAGSGTATKFAGGKIPVDQIAVAKVVDGVQEVTITVNDQGYSPAVAVVQKGVKTKIKFVAEKLSSCNSEVYFPDYNGWLNLSSGELETPVLTPESDFTFQCGMGMLHGYVKVVTDINKINVDAIKGEVAAWTPPAGSGGCCG